MQPWTPVAVTRARSSMTLEQRQKPPEPTSAPPAPVSSAHRAAPRRTPSRRRRRLRIVALLLGIPLLLCAAYWLLGMVAFADAASLVEMKGIVQTRGGDGSRWSPARPRVGCRGSSNRRCPR